MQQPFAKTIDDLPLDEAERLLDDWRNQATFARESLTIVNQESQLVPLEFTAAQKDISETLSEMEDAGQQIRLVILKPRRVHASVAVSSYIYKRTAHVAARKALVVAHLEKTTNQLREYYRHFSQNCKPFRGLIKPPHIVADDKSSGNNHLKLSNGSEFWFGTANTPEQARSFEFSFIHLSEFAFYGMTAAPLMTGLMPSIGKWKHKAIIIESTANGVNNPFHQWWQNATLGHDPLWRGKFFPWWKFHQYTASVPDPVKFYASLTDEEHQEMRKYNLSLGQAYWRRITIASDFRGDTRKFKQEFPGCPEEAFQADTARTRFDMAAVSRQSATPAPLIGELFEVEVGPQKRITLQARQNGIIHRWIPPAKGHAYVIGADSSKGRDPSLKLTGNRDPDFAAAVVMDRDTREQCATLHARINTDHFGRQLAALGRYYNNAFIVPEGSAYDIGTIHSMLNVGYPMELIYSRARSKGATSTAAIIEDMGWPATHIGISETASILDTALNEGEITIYDGRILAELSTYVMDATGHLGAQSGSHDDLVRALSLAVAGLTVAPHRITPRPWDADDDDEPTPRKRGRSNRWS